MQKPGEYRQGKPAAETTQKPLEQAVELPKIEVKTENSAPLPSLGQILIRKGLIDEDQLSEAVEIQKLSGELLGNIFVELGYLTEQQNFEALSEQLLSTDDDADDSTTEIHDESSIKIDSAAIEFVQVQYATKANAIPISVDKEKKILTLGVLDKKDTISLDEIRFKTGFTIKTVEVTVEFLEEALAKHYHYRGSLSSSRQTDILQSDFRTFTSKLTNENVPAFLNRLLSRAYELKVSDIHIDPFEKNVNIRFRLDGKLYVAATFDKSYFSIFMGRLKVMANIDIGEKKLTTDTRMSLKINDTKQIEYRVSIINSIFGERVVLRIQRDSSEIPRLDSINLPKIFADLIRQKLKSPHGMIVVTGPTGSGKTTTLYAILSELCDFSRNVLTIEDPIELTLPGASQIQAEREKGLDFSKILRGVLRQDPDVIMIGEIRDEETAQIAVSAAMTGHLVMCSLHTNDALSAVTRLEEMKVPSYYIGPCLNLVIAQRLIRRLCTHCRRPIKHAKTVLLQLGLTPNQIQKEIFYGPGGCSHCNLTGYKGRMPIFEILDIKSDMKDAISRKETSRRLKILAKKHKYIPFTILLREYFRRGVTSMEEALPYLIES